MNNIYEQKCPDCDGSGKECWTLGGICAADRSGPWSEWCINKCSKYKKTKPCSTCGGSGRIRLEVEEIWYGKQDRPHPDAVWDEHLHEWHHYRPLTCSEVEELMKAHNLYECEGGVSFNDVTFKGAPVRVARAESATTSTGGKVMGDPMSIWKGKTDGDMEL